MTRDCNLSAMPRTVVLAERLMSSTMPRQVGATLGSLGLDGLHRRRRWSSLRENLSSAYASSPDKEGKSGLGIAAERQAVERYNGVRWTAAAENVETESGKRSDRPRLAAALAPRTYGMLPAYADGRCSGVGGRLDQ